MILVTGGTGLVGIHLLMELSNIPENRIVAIYRSEKSLSHASGVFHTYNSCPNLELNWNKISWIQADITNVPSLINVFNTYSIHQVYHCAGYITFQTAAFNKLKKVNIEGTANIVNLSIDYGIDKLCYVSSIATLNLNADQVVIDETSQWNSELENSGYAISKYGGEMEVWRGKEEGLSVIIVHPGVIIGKGFTLGSSDIFCKVKKGMPFYTSGSSGYVGATDVAKAMIGLMISKLENDRFILVSENITHKKIITTIANALDKKEPNKRVSKKLIKVFAVLEEYLAFVFNYTPVIAKEMIESLFSITPYSSKKIEEKINFHFQPIQKIVEETAHTFKN